MVFDVDITRHTWLSVACRPSVTSCITFTIIEYNSLNFAFVAICSMVNKCVMIYLKS